MSTLVQTMKQFSWVLIAISGPGFSQEPTIRPLANVGPVEINFGEIEIGDPKVVQVSIENISEGSFFFDGGGFGGGSPFTSDSGTCGSSLGSGQSCSVNYKFDPFDANGSEVIGDTVLSLISADRTMQVPIRLRGRGVGALLEVSPRMIDFGDTVVGQSVVVPVTLRNRRARSSQLAINGFVGATEFSNQGGTCNFGVASGASCTINITYSPTAVGLATNQMSVGATMGGQGISDPYLISVRGRGVQAGSVVNIRPIELDFGRVNVGRTIAVPVQFTNLSGTKAVFGGGGFDLLSSDGGAFSVMPPAGAGCNANGTLDVGATCSLQYRLHPNERRDYAGHTALGFNSGSLDQTQSLIFHGTGVGTLAQVSPSLVDLGIVDLHSSKSASVLVRNTSEGVLTNFVIGSVAAPFQMVHNCSGPLAPGASCSIDFSFSATTSTLGPQAATTSLEFSDSNGANSVTVIAIRANGTDILLREGFE